MDGDNGNKIAISGNPDTYVPGEVYTGMLFSNNYTVVYLFIFAYLYTGYGSQRILLKQFDKINSTETLKPGFAKYAVDANLFRIGSTNVKDKFAVPGCFFYYSDSFRRILLVELT